MNGTLEWVPTADGLKPVVDGHEVAWAPQPGSQVAFITCPIFEAICEGNRGGGKTDALLFSFSQHVGRGWGQDWRGILCRRTYPELRDVIDKSLKWFPLIWPNARYNSAEHVWSWPSGEKLFFRHFNSMRDYWSYHGHSYPWQAREELVTWPDSKGYTAMFACARSARPGVPIQVRSTTNPYGLGHNWIKLRFRLPIRGLVGPVIRDSFDLDGEREPERVVIHSDRDENKVLLFAQPDYRQKVLAAAQNRSQYEAWDRGSWDIVAGGMLDDVWDPRYHMLPNVPFKLIPKGWLVTRSYDHGQTKPFSVGWWAVSNGEPLSYNGQVYGPVRGDLIRIAEWYGWRPGCPNEGLNLTARVIGVGIRDRQLDWGLKVVPGPADNQIFTADASGRSSPAKEMLESGIRWEESDKSPGSRKRGWQQIRSYLEAAKAYPRENPGLFALDRCAQFKRTMPTLPRNDKDLDDVDKNAEDHIGDEVRYMLSHEDRQVVSQAWR